MYLSTWLICCALPLLQEQTMSYFTVNPLIVWFNNYAIYNYYNNYILFFIIVFSSLSIIIILFLLFPECMHETFIKTKLYIANKELELEHEYLRDTFNCGYY